MRNGLLALGFLAPLAACGDNVQLAGEPDAKTVEPVDASDVDADLLIRLNDLPGVSATEATCPAMSPAGERCFELLITQPVDHDVTGGQTFTEEATLAHLGFDRPMIVAMTGYYNYIKYRRQELTDLLGANQISIEHRFFAGSTPAPADWTKLTIAQAAADEHHVIELMKTIYTTPFVTTGASKGGMTTTYHQRFYPDDVVGSVPYVAPISFALADPRYNPYTASIGTPACRQKVRDLEVELLSNARFNAMVAKTQAEAAQMGFTYTRLGIRPAVESAIVQLEWLFWQYLGVDLCGFVPPVNATDNRIWNFLNIVSAPSFNDDEELTTFDAYYYQASFELGYPDDNDSFVDGLTRFNDTDYFPLSPEGVAVPTYRPAAMADIDQWVKTAGSHMLFIYGQWDPWTGGKYDLGAATDSLLLVAPKLTHGAGFLDLTPDDKAAAYAMLEAWTGVVPDETALMNKPAGEREPMIREPRIPSAILGALRRRAP